jgi:hypothetical protein
MGHFITQSSVGPPVRNCRGPGHRRLDGAPQSRSRARKPDAFLRPWRLDRSWWLFCLFWSLGHHRIMIRPNRVLVMVRYSPRGLAARPRTVRARANRPDVSLPEFFCPPSGRTRRIMFRPTDKASGQTCSLSLLQTSHSYDS